MPHLLLDVFADGCAQPFQPRRQACTASHQQRHGMPHVMIGLAKKRNVVGPRDVAGQCRLDDRHLGHALAFGLGLRQQRCIKRHGEIP
ncbi:hypothetical protein PYX09_18845 [Xanthomonas oryzae pv. oryzae]|nr:hypothetical protein [Xanthomonas oryzae]MDI9072029.1 hypothetical protein [Xanthomonas oryzae pv. oryzae]WEL11864.1 hypothetical protein PYX09_18845 [Xanthomonas oryzae pv. oryzae]